MVSRTLASGVGVAMTLSVLSTATPAWAAKPSRGGGGATSATTGIDVSYPQCSSTLPSGQAFAIVGVNGGLANDYNSCLGPEFAYASGNTGTPKQAPAQTYLNTADPGNTVGDWPTTASPGAAGAVTNPYGSCDGSDSTSCAWAYGYDMVAGITTPAEKIIGDLAAFTAATGGELYSQPVWLDVETTNSWLSNLSMNTVDLQGMVAAVKDAATAAGTTAAPVGIYTTAYQWAQIVSSTPLGTLSGLNDWVPGARRESAAASNCGSGSFTAGAVTITQWTGTYDYDYSCTG